jgi:hypothetical protein
MTIIWTVSHPEWVVVAVGRNEVTATDILFCVHGMLNAGGRGIGGWAWRLLLTFFGWSVGVPAGGVAGGAEAEDDGRP